MVTAHNERDSTGKWWDKYGKKWRLYPHLIMTPEDGGLRCNHCGLFIPPLSDGSIDMDASGCTERKNACSWCGERPLCAPERLA